MTVIQPFLDNGKPRPGELSTSGDPALGGVDMDDSLMRYLINKANLEEKKDDPNFMSKLQEKVEKSKIELSLNPDQPMTDIYMRGKREKMTLTQEELNTL